MATMNSINLQFACLLATALLLPRVACVEERQYLATTIITETVYTVCGLEPPETESPAIPFLFSTDIRLADDTIVTGVTVQPPSSPSSCYALPTPTSSLEVVALSGTEGDIDTSDSSPAFFYMGDNATAPQYLGTLIDGSRCLLDLSSAASEEGQIALILPNNQSIVFDSNGMHLYSSGCRSVNSVQISNFTGQVVQVDDTSNEANATAKLKRSLMKREATQTNFTVIVQANTTLQYALSTMNLTYGPSPCDGTSMTTGNPFDTLIWTCQYPGVLSGEATCQAGFNGWVNGSASSSSFSGAPGSAGDFLSFLSPFVNKTGPTLSSLLPPADPLIQQGLSWLGNTAQRVVNNAVDVGGTALCGLLHSSDEYALVLYGPDVLTNYTLGSFATPPVPTITQTLGVAETTEPPRIVLPSVTNFPPVTISIFNPISFLGGLLGGSASGGLLGGGIIPGILDASTTAPTAMTTVA